MGDRKRWDELYEEANREVQRWRRKHKKATLTEIEDTVDEELAELRPQMIQDLARESQSADLRSMTKEERPKCPQCGRPLVANGQQKRRLTTDLRAEGGAEEEQRVLWAL